MTSHEIITLKEAKEREYYEIHREKVLEKIRNNRDVRNTRNRAWRQQSKLYELALKRAEQDQEIE